MKKSTVIMVLLVSAVSLYIGMEIQRRREGSIDQYGGNVSRQAQTKTAPSRLEQAKEGGQTGLGAGRQKAASPEISSVLPSPAPAGRGGVAVEVVPISVGEIRRLGVFTGSLEARSQFVLSTKIPGRLRSVFVDVGDEVKKGQVVARLEEEDHRYPLQQAFADLEAARANLEDALGSLETAKREYERAKSLHESKIISAVELEAARSQYRKAETSVRVVQAQVKQREAASAIAQDRLDSTQIVASWDSEEPVRIVGERFANPGSLLRANDPIFSLLDIHSLFGLVNVTEQDYPLLRVGQAAQVRAEIFPDRVFTGRVERIAPFLNPATRQAAVRIAIPNRGRELKPGMFIQVEVEYQRKPRATILPDASLVTRGANIGVFLLRPEEKKVSFVEVQVGIRERGMVEIVSPKISGQVVITGQHLLQDGSSVVLIGDRRL